MNDLNIKPQAYNNVISLLQHGATVPFIARYRKEQTGNLDEVDILNIKKDHDFKEKLQQRKEFILNNIQEQNKLSAALKDKINQTQDLKSLEDLYLPFKTQKKSKGKIAIDNGLLPLAKIIMSQNSSNLKRIAKDYCNSNIPTTEEALEGAQHIVADWINENTWVRSIVRNVLSKTGWLSTKVKKNKIKEAIKYKSYHDFKTPYQKIASHQFLAMQRGVNEKLLTMTLEGDENLIFKRLKGLLIKNHNNAENIELAIQDAYKRLLKPSIVNELLTDAKSKADATAIQIFSKNLKQLLLQAPLGKKRVLAIDPGIRTGCKTVALSEAGDLMYDTVLYILKSPDQSEKIALDLIQKHKIAAIAIGNGTGGNECLSFFEEKIKPHYKDLEIHFVSEQGASIYSASEVAREEFPDHDLTVRGAVSIGRRLIDPLAELVKLDPQSIGVGQYQHDVNQKLLKEELDEVVLSCVNKVGVNLNTASKHLLAYVSGLGPALAEKIVDYRSKNGAFKNRKALLKVPRLGTKAYEQCAGFLRINGASHPLDNSAVHPESYPVVAKMAKDLNVEIASLIGNEGLCQNIPLEKYQSEHIGLPTLQDIKNELLKPGRDPRGPLSTFKFAKLKAIDDLSIGMELPGIVTNITAFGCFVDIGVHQDALLHISEMSDHFIKNPNDAISLNEKIKVKIIALDLQRKRISLTRKGL